jgi:DNA (cytosine-5)-methyltransferase 1
MAAYYNEIDPAAAAWIRELIKEGVITDGEVDERSIEDVLPADVAGFDRVHWFAGIGVWDYALNLAHWPDDRRVWTGSCPCQPFSAAGKGEGFADERHLWPALFHHILVGRPDAFFGEQVASKDGLTWLDLVSSDLEGIAYTTAAVDIPVAGFGGPHRRQRLFFVADAISERGCGGIAGSEDATDVGEPSKTGSLEYSEGERQRRIAGIESEPEREAQSRREDEGCRLSGTRDAGPTDIVDDPESQRWRQGRSESAIERRQLNASEPSIVNGFWHDAEWIYCRDEKYRPTKPGIFPLVNGAAGRVALLRGAGNAISPEVAKAFIASYLEIV